MGVAKRQPLLAASEEGLGASPTESQKPTQDMLHGTALSKHVSRTTATGTMFPLKRPHPLKCGV